MLAVSMEREMSLFFLLNQPLGKSDLCDIADQLENCLGEVGKLNLLCASLRIADDESIIQIGGRALKTIEPNFPIPSLSLFTDEAKEWVRFASLEERKAYFWILWQTLPGENQVKFIRHVSSKEVF